MILPHKFEFENYKFEDLFEKLLDNNTNKKN